jgi:hypothetical protein
MATLPQPASRPGRRFPWWIPLWAVILAALYLPTLATRFDFIDDGNLVYPAPAMSPVQRVELVWQKIVANYNHLGPFRPVLWVHWETAADLFQANPVTWRAARVVWSALAAGAFLWLLRELRIRPGAAILTAAIALWNPFRSEIWTSLTLAEGVAMPYALVALVCAVRGARSRRPWKWDLAGGLCVLAALGCKNNYTVLVPAQMLLRVLADGLPLREAVRRHGRRACLLMLPLLMPVIHFIVYKLNWHPGQYTMSPSLAQVQRMLGALAGAVSVDFVGPGLALAGLALAIARFRRGQDATGPAEAEGERFWQRHRAACVAGAALLLLGIGIYLPFNSVAGRYTMPAVWGVDLGIAVLLHELAGVRLPVWRRTAYAALGCGLIAVAAATVGKEEKLASRSAMLWNVLEYVAKEAPPGACVAWVDGPQLNVEEGIHFLWHLRAHGRADLSVCPLDDEGRPLQRDETAAHQAAPLFLVSGTPRQPATGSWQPVRTFSIFYWGKRRHFDCYLWQETAGISPAAR